MDEGEKPNLDAVGIRIADLQHEVDALQAAFAKQDRPWYRDASTLIALFALVFSLASTYIADRKADVQDLENQKTDLRNLLQQLDELPKDNVEARVKFAGNTAALQTYTGFINQDNAILSAQAADIARKLPSGSVSAVEYYAIAMALQGSYDIDDAKYFLGLADKSVSDFNTEISIIRANANLLFYSGKIDEGRREFQNALNIFEKYPHYDPFTEQSSHTITELDWAQAEFNVRNYSFVKQHIDEAEKHFADMTASPNKAFYQSLIQQAKADLLPTQGGGASAGSLTTASASDSAEIAGTWRGTPNGLLPLVFHVGNDGNSTAESPSQQSTAQAFANVQENWVTLTVPTWNIIVSGSLTGDVITGILNLNGQKSQLVLTRDAGN
jgi:tetratricopeptide (TPR) repeat protein